MTIGSHNERAQGTAADHEDIRRQFQLINRVQPIISPLPFVS
jgi:hypothetical protein